MTLDMIAPRNYNSLFQLTGVNLMWIVFHSIFWDGNVANKEDIIDSLLSPGNMNDKD